MEKLKLDQDKMGGSLKAAINVPVPQKAGYFLVFVRPLGSQERIWFRN